ncbi:hypothetical protein NDU88_003025 [Pleurodeles waltl]|uniref:Uncharacterized protein n=1 Tax=Pleurodeles waltl TaxID=8319 RepID=A0AAV7P8T7_PLEWA|nr:hypothetical protein NDU88_003025 [Pleurodeles waltl]
MTVAQKPRPYRRPLHLSPGQRCKHRCPGDYESPTASLSMAVDTAMERLAVRGRTGPLGAPALPMHLAWAVEGPPGVAPSRISLPEFRAVKCATGATAPAAHQHCLPARLRAGGNVDVPFPLGQRTVTLLPSAGPAEMSE